MNAVGSFVEAVPGLQDGFGLSLHLRPDSALDDIADDRAGMAVGDRELAGTIGDLNDRYLEVATSQLRQSVREGDSRLPHLHLMGGDLRRKEITPSEGSG